MSFTFTLEGVWTFATVAAIALFVLITSIINKRQ